jgi:hypothetical protein
VHKALLVLREHNIKRGTSIKLVNTEWLPDTNSPGPLPDPEVPVHYGWSGKLTNLPKQNLAYRQGSWFYALNAADRLADYLSYGGEFHLANFNNCVNTWGQNIIDASKEGAWLSPAGRIFAFMGSGFQAAYPLETSLTGRSDALLKAIACEEAYGKGLVVYVVNHGTEGVELTLNLPEGFSADGAETIFAPDRLSRNTLDRDAVQSASLASPQGGVWSIKPLSVTKFHAQRIGR